MKMNTKSRMAIAAIIDVAVHATDRPVTLADVGKRQAISASYLEQLFRKLRERGIVASTRGPGGGYRLNRHLSAITVTDIIAAVDDQSLDSCACKNGGGGDACKSHGLWCRVNHHLHDYLSTVTLASIIEDVPSSPLPSPQSMAAEAAQLH